MSKTKSQKVQKTPKLPVDLSARFDFAVIGNGLTACVTLSRLLSQGKKVAWLLGTGSSLSPPLPVFESNEKIAQFLEQLQPSLELGPVSEGSFVREWKSKGFTPPPWHGSPLEDARPMRDESIHNPEAFFVPVQDARFEMNLGQIESSIRAAVESEIAQCKDHVRIEGVPLLSISELDLEYSIALASGQIVKTSEIIYCDRWSRLRSITGLAPKITLLSDKPHEVKLSDIEGKWGRSAAIQVFFEHTEPVLLGSREGFLALLPRDSKDEQHSYVLGCFSLDGLQSVWTAFVSADHAEDNHEISKKLRRIKQVLQKMLAPTTPDFAKTIQSERVHFEEECCCLKAPSGILSANMHLVGSLKAFPCLTDAFGPSAGLLQTQSLFEVLALASGEMSMSAQSVSSETALPPSA